MKIVASHHSPFTKTTPLIAVFVGENEPLPLPAHLRDFAKRLTDKEFAGKENQLCLLHPSASKPERLLLVGLGKKDKTKPEKLRRAIGKTITQIVNLGLGQAGFVLTPDQVYPATEAAELAAYRFTRFKKADSQAVGLKSLMFYLPSAKDIARARKEIRAAQVITTETNWVRETANLPGNVVTPAVLAQYARQSARATGLKCTVLDKAALIKGKFGGLLAVGGGSDNDPRLIVLEYSPRGRSTAKKRAPIALVGKAITFDSGGISIKPAASMDEMKFDKCGGVAVIGAMRAIARLKLSQPVIGIIASAENMPSSRSYRPGDIVTSYRGRDKQPVTIEVLNTDAEGRIILGDALVHARERGAKMIIDFATLTGACLVALGQHAAGLFGNDDQLVEQLRCAGEVTGERCWPLPLWDEYKSQIKSHVADHQNTGGRYGGASTAAAFLARYVNETPWAHIDIAGTAWATEDKPYYVKGATGFGVRLVLEFLQQHRG